MIGIDKDSIHGLGLCILLKTAKIVHTVGFLKTVPSASAGCMKTVLSVYTLLMSTIYLSLSTQVAEGTVSRKRTVPLYSGIDICIVFSKRVYTEGTIFMEPAARKTKLCVINGHFSLYN